MTVTIEPQHLDALVVGAGFGGIYQLKKLLDQGLDVMGIDMADDVGGTWYWNRYPGAMSDTMSFLYRYSWDHEDLVSYPWSHHYLQGPEILAYLKHIVKKYDLRQHFQFKTELIAAEWSEEERRWTVKLSTNQIFKVKYLVTALGLLSKTNYPAFPGLDKFASKGELYHTARWPENIDLKGKRVGVIGNGSTGRSPQYSVPAGNGLVSTQHREHLNETYDQVWDQAKNNLFAYGFDEELDRTVASVTSDERERIFEEAWQQGNGFRFMFWTFSDITVNEQANIAASDFIKRKICQAVKDPEKARKLCPTEWYARRPLCDSGYYEQFNRENVDIVDIKTNPITEMTADGIITSDGTLHELDVMIFATGFDAVDGNYTRIAIKGRNGETLRDHWSNGPTSYLGISVPNFPNLFLITGPNGPFANLPPAIECHVEIITDLIARAEKNELPKIANGTNTNTNGHTISKTSGIVEALPEAEQDWSTRCDELSSKSLFRHIDSWIFGKNVPGKKAATMFFFAGLGPYRKTVREILDDDLRGFKRF